MSTFIVGESVLPAAAQDFPLWLGRALVPGLPPQKNESGEVTGQRASKAEASRVPSRLPAPIGTLFWSLGAGLAREQLSARRRAGCLRALRAAPCRASSADSAPTFALGAAGAPCHIAGRSHIADIVANTLSTYVLTTTIATFHLTAIPYGIGSSPRCTQPAPSPIFDEAAPRLERATFQAHGRPLPPLRRPPSRARPPDQGTRPWPFRPQLH